jgi:hypothetical protein
LHRIPDDEREVLLRTVPVGHRGLGFGYPHDDVIVCSMLLGARSSRTQG